MPFLRVVGPDSLQGDAVIELRSSKTLIGAGTSTCDVVLPDADGVLEVHALLSLSPAKSSGSLVPFSTAAGGACYLNGQQIPQDGVRVVHGDRLAFGASPGYNAFIFELTGNRSTNSLSSTIRQSSTRDFRKALDALRGDRESTQRQRMAHDLSATSLASASPDKSVKGAGVGASREEQFSKLLANASSDSAMSGYVERKLRERQLKSIVSITDSELNGGRAMMEPPPSLLSSMSESTGSRAASSFKDSILDRPIGGFKDKSLTSSSAFTSTAEKNYAEIEKLHLSQRMRQVNRVLNGSMTFGDSYMAGESEVGESKNSVDDDDVLSRTRTSSIKTSIRKPSNNLHRTSVEEERELSEVDDDDDDELPIMSEKPPQPTSVAPKVTESSDTTKLNDQGFQIQDQKEESEHIDDLEDEQEESLTDSLPGFSEHIRGAAAKALHLNARSVSRASTGSAKANSSRLSLAIDPAAAVPATKTRTALHQKLIDQAIHQRQLDTVAEVFVRWKRGLRIQAQRRLQKAQQQRKLSEHLRIRRRNQAFSKWHSLASIQSQIVSCRIDAFQTRSGSRLVCSAFFKWARSTQISVRAKHMLHGILTRTLLRHNGKAFRTWRENLLLTGQTSSEDRLRVYYDVHIENRLINVAVRHFSRVNREKLHRIARAWLHAAKEEKMMARQFVHTARCHFDRSCRERLRRVLKCWQAVGSKVKRRCGIINRLIHRQASDRVRRALAIWKVESLIRRSEQTVRHEVEKVKTKSNQELEKLDERHRSTKREIESELSRRLKELGEKLQHKDTALKVAMSKIEERKQQKVSCSLALALLRPVAYCVNGRPM